MRVPEVLPIPPRNCREAKPGRSGLIRIRRRICQNPVPVSPDQKSTENRTRKIASRRNVDRGTFKIVILSRIQRAEKEEHGDR